LELRRGLLQGSALSPILFNIYINDLIEMINQNTNIGYGYADDIIIICEDRTETIKIINKIEIWSKENTMDLNKNKCGILNIRKTKDKKCKERNKKYSHSKRIQIFRDYFRRKIKFRQTP
jgi:membrane glycosyltransferase